MTQAAILEAFAELKDRRRCAGQRHTLPLCLALFTLAYSAGNKGFLAIGDWLKAYEAELIELFKPEKDRLPSYSTIRRVLLNLDYRRYSACLAHFFGISPKSGRDIGDGWQSAAGFLSRSLTIIRASDPHPALKAGECLPGRTRLDFRTL